LPGGADVLDLEVTVGLAEHVELVIEVDNRVRRTLTTGTQQRRHEYHRPQDCQDEQDRQGRQDLSNAVVCDDEGNNE
jgi:hypothetical protein